MADRQYDVERKKRTYENIMRFIATAPRGKVYKTDITHHIKCRKDTIYAVLDDAVANGDLLRTNTGKSKNGKTVYEYAYTGPVDYAVHCMTPRKQKALEEMSARKQAAFEFIAAKGKQGALINELHHAIGGGYTSLRQFLRDEEQNGRIFATRGLRGMGATRVYFVDKAMFDAFVREYSPDAANVKYGERVGSWGMVGGVKFGIKAEF